MREPDGPFGFTRCAEYDGGAIVFVQIVFVLLGRGAEFGGRLSAAGDASIGGGAEALLFAAAPLGLVVRSLAAWR